MLRYVALRLGQAALTLVASSFIVFALVRTSGSPADLLLPAEATPAERAAFIARMGFDRPIAYQFGAYLRSALQGDWGRSLRTGKPAVELVRERFWNSLKLATAAVAVTLVISVPLGVLAAARRGGPWDRIGMSFAVLGQSLPAFWLGIVLVLVFAVWLRWLPTSGMGTWRHYVLPAVVLGWGISAGVVRLLRSSMLEVLDSEFVKLARTKGLRESIVVWKHALRNALIPVITFVGFMYGVIVAAAIVVEVVFGWPGLGRLAYESTLWRDFPVLQLTVVVWTALVIGINLLVDLSYGLVDPRIRSA
jgi:peptide/nickel transport system permease protein